MKLNVAVQMDPIERINIRGDSTFALLLEAQRRGHALAYYTPDRLAMRADNISNAGALCVSLSPLSKGSGLITGSYDIPAASLRSRAVFTNTMSTNAYRSSGRPEVTFAIERLIKSKS